MKLIPSVIALIAAVALPGAPAARAAQALATPAYPAAAHGASGRVDVDCVIGVDGLPHRCRVAYSDGGIFTQTVLAWLTGPHRPHFASALRNDTPVPELHRLVICFGASS